MGKAHTVNMKGDTNLKLKEKLKIPKVKHTVNKHTHLSALYWLDAKQSPG